METRMEAIASIVLAWVRQLQAQLQEPTTLYQLLALGMSYALAVLLARLFTPPLEAQLRQVHGKPALLRWLVVVLRRLPWIIFIPLVAALIELEQSLGWNQGREQLLFIALQLSLAWLCITLLSQTIRNRSLRGLMAKASWLFVAMLVLGITDNIAELLDTVGFAVGSTRISLLLLGKVALVLVLTFWLAQGAGNFIELRLQASEGLAPGLKVLAGKMLRGTLLVLAALMALSGVGVDLTVFSVLSGVIGVGIGFGLQRVVSNLISGLIILADQSVKPGDTISLGNTFGWVRELRARFVSVITRDGREYLIPNEDFITQEVINWSFSDDLVRLDVEFRVSYEADPHEVARLAIEAARSVPRVVDANLPVCWLTGFGESALDLILRFWIRDPQNGLTNIRGQVLLALWDTFKANGIVIPYPHRELIIKTDTTVAPLAPGSASDQPL